MEGGEGRERQRFCGNSGGFSRSVAIQPCPIPKLAAAALQPSQLTEAGPLAKQAGPATKRNLIE